MPKYFFVGFDQAFANSGHAVLCWDSSKKKLEYVDSGIFHPTVKWGHKSDAVAFLEHQKHIKDVLTGVMSMGELCAVGIEGVAYAAPGQAASRGGIWALYSTMGVLYGDLVVITPTSLKKYLTYYGFAEKEDIKKAIAPRYGLENTDFPYDQYDAIGIAEVTAFAFLILHGYHDDVKKLISSEQYKIFKNPEKVVKYRKRVKSKKDGKKEPRQIKSVKLKGICDRIDDFYLEKRTSP